MSPEQAHPEGGGQRVAGGAVVTSITMIAAMALGGLLAVVVLLEFGKDAETDGFFAAYGVYAVLLALAQSLRATAVAKLVEGASLFDNLERLLGAALIVTAIASVAMIGFGAALADLLTGDLGPEAEDAARTALAILAIAAGGQLVGALGAAALGVRGHFAWPGLAYVVGGVFAIGFVFSFSGSLGIDAVSLGVAAGSFLTLALMLARLVSLGWRPTVGRVLEGRRALGTVGLLFAGAIGSLGLQLTYVVSVAFAARIGEGDVTLYSYAFFAAALLMGAVAGPTAVVLAAPVARTWDRRSESLEPHLVAVLRAGLVLAVPAFGIAAIAGDELIELVLGGSFTASDADRIVNTFLAMGGMVLATIAVPVPALAAYATSRYLAVAMTSVGGLAVHVAASAVAVDIGLAALGAAASLATMVSLVLLLAVIWRGTWPHALWLVLRHAAPIAAVAAVTFGLAGAAGAVLGGGAWDALAAAAGAVALLVLTRAFLPADWDVARRMVEPFSRGRRAQALMISRP